MKSIGEPQGAGNRQNVSIEYLWIEQVAQLFQKTEEDHGAASLQQMEKYRDEKVDKMRIQKDKELEDYRREIERAKKFEKSKLLQQQEQRRK